MSENDMKMTNNKWAAMTVKERAEYLLNGEFKVKKLNGIPADSMVGDITVITSYEGSSSGVVISERLGSLADCLENSALNLREWEKALVEDSES